MNRSIILVAALEACHKDTVAPDSPVAAARCEAAAIHAQDYALLAPCVVPEIRDELADIAAKRGIEWSKYAAEQARLEAAKPDDFQLRTIPENRREVGDQVASLKLGKDSLEVVHAKDGHWYIVDTGF